MSTITVTPTVELGNTPPRVRLDVSDANLPGYFSANVVRHNPDGRTVPVRTTDGNALTLTTSGANRVGLVYDYEAPFGQPVTYSTLESPATVSAEVTVAETRVWLIHPGVPSLSISIDLRAGSLAEEVYAVEQAVFYPLGRRTPVINTDGSRKAMQSSLTIAVDSLSELSAVLSLVQDSSSLLLNVPPSLGMGVETTYIAPGTVTNARISDIGDDPHRAISMGFHAVDRPAGGTQAERTYLDLLTYPTYGQLAAAYPSYLALLSGP